MSDARIGTELAGYRIERLLGRGGMGEVYLATQSFPERRVAVKVLARELAEDGDFRERFIRESNAAASTEHPNIVPIYGAGEHDGVLYLAMRYVEGADLGTLIARDGPMSASRTARIVAQVAAALDAAHRRGLVHRDVKPGNILIAEGAEDHAYLSDFGLIKRSELDTGLTKTGQFMGSIDYCAPEQIRGDPVDERADIYSLGCILFECLTGERPFARPTEVATMYGHLEAPPPSAAERRPELPVGVDAVIAKAMAKRPDDRYATAGELANAARRALGVSSDEYPVEGSSAPQRPRRRGALLVAATILVLGVAAIVWAVTRNAPTTSTGTPQGAVSAIRIDPDTNSVATSLHEGLEAVDAVAGEGALWIVNRDGVTKRDETTGKLETVIPVDDPLSIRDAFGALWVSTHAGAVATVVKIDPAIDEVVATVDVSPDSALVLDTLAIEAGEGSVWALDDQGHLTKIEPLSGKAVARFDVGAGAGLAVGGDAIWAADNLHDQISKIDPATGEILTTIDVPFAPDVIAYLGGALWAIDTGAATVTPIDGSTLQPGRSIGVATDPVAISGGFGSVWVAGGDAVTRIDVVTDVAVTIPVDFASSAVAVDARTRAVWLIKRPPGYAYG